MPLRVIIADDHPIFRSGLRGLLKMDPGFVVMAEAGDGLRTIELVNALGPDVLLLDLAMPGMSGLDVLRAIGRDQPRTRTVVLTAAIRPGDMALALRLGAVGIILKTEAGELLFDCLRTVMAGMYWVGRDAFGSFAAAMAKVDSMTAARSRRFGLTKRELQVVRLIAEGWSNKEIAAELSISDDTVKQHARRAFDKTGTFSRVELALFAVHHDLVDRDDPGA